MKRLKYAAAIALSAALGLAPLTAGAAPSPSPSLDTLLAKPPGSDFTELTTASFHGQFTAHDWAINSTGASTADTEATLKRNGFVDGYGKTWTSTSSQHGLVEIVMAFSGGQGARTILSDLERGDKKDQHYLHADTLAGISPSYGVHYADSTSGVYEDGFGFVKGNDLFELAFVSAKDDALTPASSQAKTQYDSAPDGTIPSSSWPENATRAPSFPVAAFLIAIAFVVVVVGLVAFLVLRRRTPAVAGPYGMAPMQGGYGVAAGSPGVGAPGEVQLSPDGNYWWDGQAWKDASLEVPPGAQRSSDGSLWWDGRNWRPVRQEMGQQPPPTS